MSINQRLIQLKIADDRRKSGTIVIKAKRGDFAKCEECNLILNIYTKEFANTVFYI